jgi:solute:Na+ symporter, SSS family
MDIFKRHLRPTATEHELVRVGRIASAACIVLAILIAYGIFLLKGSLFYYVQMAYSFFAPPFSAVFLLGTLWRRINARGALVAVLAGFAFAFGLKLYAEILPPHLGYEPWAYATTFPIQALGTWLFSMIVCSVVSLATPPPRPEQVTDDLTFAWHRLRIRPEPGHRWYQGVAFWWALSVVLMFGLMFVFGVVL